MTDYPFDMQLVVDPTNPSNVVPDGEVTIYAPSDVAGTNPLTLTDPSGLPIINPLVSNGNGFLQPFVATLPQVMWKSGTYQGYFNSYVGMRDEAVAAREAAEVASAAAVDAAGLVDAPADEVIEAAIRAENSGTRDAVESVVFTEVTGQSPTNDALLDFVEARTEEQVPPLVTEALAADDTVANAAAAAAGPAVDAKVAGLSLVKKGDPGIPVTGEPGSLYSIIWNNKYLQMIMALTDANRLKLFKGLEVGTSKVDSALDDEYAKATRDAAGRIAEDAIKRDGTVPSWVLTRWKDRMGLGTPAVTATTVTVKPDGTGDYLSPKLANAAFVPATGKTLEIVVYPGTYTDNEWIVKEGVTIRGTSREACILDGSLPATATDTQITNTSTLWVQGSCRLENLTILMKNGRYAVHAEASGAYQNAQHYIINCHIEHAGNQEVVDYRAANSLPAGSVWASDRAWGYGSSSGWYQRFENVTFVSRRGAWYVHDNLDFAKPINHDLIGCRIVAREFATSTFDAQSLGAGQSSRINVYNSENSFLQVLDSDSPWITQKPENQVAQHAQIRTTVSGKDPIGYRTTNRGKALKIESNSTGTVSTVRVSGTAATAIWGQGTYRDGGGGLKGYGYGYWDISGILVSLNSNVAVDNTLGKRLGDCSAVNKTLTVTVDGGTPVNVVFSANHTADSNAAILSIINTALGSAAVASEYLVTQGETYAIFPDRQKTLRNTSTTVGIPRFAAVKAGTQGDVLLLGTADPASLMIGVALEPIPPGKTGRILTSGLLHYTQIPGFVGTVSPGTPIYLSDTTAGTYSASGTRQAFTGYVTDWAKF